MIGDGVLIFLRIYFLISGVFFFFSTAVAMLRFEDVYARLHAASKCLTGGSVSLLIAYLMFSGQPSVIMKVFLAAFFMLLTNPMASHALARSAYRRGYGVACLNEDQFARDRWESKKEEATTEE